MQSGKVITAGQTYDMKTQNMSWLIWIFLCGCVYVECRKGGWKEEPCCGKNFQQQWPNSPDQGFPVEYQFPPSHFKHFPSLYLRDQEMPQSSPMTGHRAIHLRVQTKHSGHEHSSEHQESNENSDPLEDCRSESDFINGPLYDPENRNFTPTRQNPLPFNYQAYDDPPVLWPCFDKKCRGDRQSPINIDTEVITPNPEMGPLEFQNYDKPLRNLPIKYVGNDVYFSVPQCANITVTSKWLKNTYRLFQVAISFRKSVHTVDSQYFPMEISMLNLNTKYRKNEDFPDAMLSLQILVQVKKTNNKGLNPVIEVLKDIRKINANTTLKSPLAMADLLPQMNSSYITYKGSRAVPPCSEIFTHIIFHYSNSIGKQQLQMFNKLEVPDDLNRFVTRPIQPLNERKIWSSVPEENNNDQNNGNGHEENNNGQDNGNGWWKK